MLLTLARLFALALASLVLPAGAAAASLTIVAPSPAPGAEIQTTAAGARVTLAWSADSSDCAQPQTIARPVLAGPIMASVATIAGVSPSGANVLRLLGPVRAPTAITWHVMMPCDGTAIRTEKRVFTLMPPDPHPRVTGRFRVAGLGAERIWSMRPACPRGACLTTAHVPGVGAIRLRYRPASAVYAASVGGAVAARVPTCLGPDGAPVSGAYRGTFTLSLRASRTAIRGAGTQAQGLRGSFAGEFTPTATGVAAGCRAFSPRRAITGEILPATG